MDEFNQKCIRLYVYVLLYLYVSLAVFVHTDKTTPNTTQSYNIEK